MPIAEKDITPEIVRSELSYDPKTGAFLRISTGKIAGSSDSWGHRQIRVRGRLTMAHRLAWLLMRGNWPQIRIDHRDGNPDNNKWSNLRLATAGQNTCNARTRSDNKSGLKGASFHPGSGKWQATAGGKYIGLFSTAEDAHAAYCREAQKRFGEFARTA